MKQLQITLLLIVTFSTLSYAGGPWPQPKGKGYFKLSEWWTTFDQHYTDQGLLDPNVTTGIYNTFIYAEYGVTDRLTTIVNGSIFSRNYMNNLRSATTNEVIISGEALNSIGDIDLGVKYGLNKPGSKVPLAVSFTLGIPTGTAVAGTLENLQTGDGEFNQMIQIAAGTGFKLGSVQAYMSAYTGINYRTNGFSEEFRLGAEVGFQIIPSRLWITSKLDIVESFKNGSTAETVTSTGIFANNTEFTSISLEASYYITKRIGISAGIAGAVRGEIIAASPSYSAGVFYDLK